MCFFSWIDMTSFLFCSYFPVLFSYLPLLVQDKVWGKPTFFIFFNLERGVASHPIHPPSWISPCFFMHFKWRYSSSRSQMFLKIGVLQSFANFTGKQLHWNFFLIKLKALSPATLLKKDSNSGVSFFYSAPRVAAF